MMELATPRGYRAAAGHETRETRPSMLSEPERSTMQLDNPRATRIDLDDLNGPLPGELWVGGGWADFGAEVLVDDIAEAVVLDLAGTLPDPFREAARTWRSFVFDDVDATPDRFDRIVALAAEMAAIIRNEAADHRRVYVFCQYGMNRSNLVAGLVLRHLGMPGPDTVRHLQRHRPGALGNDAYRRLIEAFVAE
jgi:hypothetical protein